MIALLVPTPERCRLRHALAQSDAQQRAECTVTRRCRPSPSLCCGATVIGLDTIWDAATDHGMLRWTQPAEVAATCTQDVAHECAVGRASPDCGAPSLWPRWALPSRCRVPAAARCAKLDANGEARHAVSQRARARDQGVMYIKAETYTGGVATLTRGRPRRGSPTAVSRNPYAPLCGPSPAHRPVRQSAAPAPRAGAPGRGVASPRSSRTSPRCGGPGPRCDRLGRT